MTFFALPRELRDEIYAIVLTSDRSTDQSFVRIRANAAYTLVISAFMLTCKQIYEEAQSLFIRSLKFVVQDNVAPDSTQQWLKRSLRTHNVRDVRTVVLTSLESFRTANPCERQFILNTQKGMPWMPRQQISPTIIFTDDDFSRDPFFEELNISQFLLALPCLQHVELGLSVKRFPDAEDRAQWGMKHYYNLESLKNIGTLKSVTINMVLNGAIRWKLYKTCVARMEKGCLRRLDRITKSALEDAYGLRSWLKEGFQHRGLEVDVRCICHNLDPYREVP
jgi:hypothetical protein